LLSPPLRTSKKFYLYLLSHAIVIPARQQAGVNNDTLVMPPAVAKSFGEQAKKRHLRGEAVTAPALADNYILHNY